MCQSRSLVGEPKGHRGRRPLRSYGPWIGARVGSHRCPILRPGRPELKTVRAYLLKETFQQFWDYKSPAWAGKFLDAWCWQTMRSRIEPMKKIVRMWRSHRELILNYFKAKKVISSGTIEGLNNKAKVTMRKSYGFRTFHVTELALYHTLRNLPEPEIAHKFY